MDGARFFHRLMVDEDRKEEIRHDPNAFGYFHFAFQSYASAVISVLKALAKDEFPSWFRGWQSRNPGEFSRLQPLISQRGSAVHGSGPKTKRKVRAVPAERVSGVQVFGPPAIFLGEEHAKALCDLGLPPWCQAWIGVAEHTEKDGTKVVDRCRTYLDLLDRLLSEFEKRENELT
jgi:hypothetical protein